jgi:photosystem II stability/assembly factor-like uncharacterized protein
MDKGIATQAVKNTDSETGGIQNTNHLGRGWRVNRRRLRWFAGAFVVLLGLSTWFCGLQPSHPSVNHHSHFPLLSWWCYPREEAAFKRLPVVPLVNFRGCFFTNNSGWVVGDQGVILHTSDRGEHWTMQTNIVWGESEALDPVPPGNAAKAESKSDPNLDADKANSKGVETKLNSTQQAPLNPSANLAKLPLEEKMEAAQSPPLPRKGQTLSAVAFVDAHRGWVVGDRGTILHTTNGGQSWLTQTNFLISLTSITFGDSEHGWLGGGFGSTMRTLDGGRLWLVQTNSYTDGFGSMAFVDAQYGWALNGYRTILHTSDGAQSWVTQTNLPTGFLNSLTFINRQCGWAAGSQGIMSTTDGGKSWLAQTNPTSAVFYSLAFVDLQRGWAVGDEGIILRTIDGGRSWQAQTNLGPMDLSSLFIVDPQDGWAIGREGTILRTADGGQSWHPQATSISDLLISVSFADTQQGWATAYGGSILRTTDGGRSWNVQTNFPSSRLRSLFCLDSQRGWVVGENGIITHTTDGGQTWVVRTNVASWNLNSISFVDAQRGWVAGDNGTILRTDDGGQLWVTQTNESARGLNSISFVDAQRGWAASDDGTILHTEDGGRSWVTQTNSSGDDLSDLSSITFKDVHHGWAVSRDGTILGTVDGGQSWLVQTNFPSAFLFSVTFADRRQGWATGLNGRIFHTTNGGESWQVQTSFSNYLTSITFVDSQHGWAVGAAGMILRTTDGGLSWSEQRPYRRSPAPLFYLSLLVPAGMLWRGFRRDEKDDEREKGERQPRSIADYAVSDRPLTSQDFDALNFGALSAGISNFLRNENTTGPLTLAITGPWGSGKSSIMGLLKENLHRLGFRPVWFNAWHHQQEEQLLAGLLESIREQAVPSMLTIEGTLFRLKLVQARLQRSWPVVLLAVACVAAFAAIIHYFGGDITKSFADIESNKQLLPLAGKLAVVVTGIVALFKVYHGFQAFGVDPAKLLASVADKAKLSDLSAQTSFRHRFAQEFAEVTEALQPRTMTIFIDDLDRCEPDQVMQVLQSLNFLATSGQCFLIVGMEEAAVTNCVAVSLKAQFDVREGHELKKEDSVKRRWEHARLWMEKLIQIRVPVPDLNSKHIKALLEGRNKAKNGPVINPVVRWSKASVERLKPFLSIAAAVVLAWGCFSLVLAYLNKQKTLATKAEIAREKAPVTWSSNSILQPRNLSEVSLEGPAGVVGSSLIDGSNFTNWVSTQKWTIHLSFDPNTGSSNESISATVKNPVAANPSREQTNRPQTKRGDDEPPIFDVHPGQKDHSGWIFPLLLIGGLLVFSGKKLIDRLNIEVQDSNDFLAELEKWSGRINQSHKTPRAVKRLVNKLRFHAMMLRALPRSENESTSIRESIIVAFGVLDEENGDIMSQFLANPSDTTLPAEWPLTGELAGTTQAMASAIAERPDLFQFLRGSVRARSEPIPKSTSGNETPP